MSNPRLEELRNRLRTEFGYAEWPFEQIQEFIKEYELLLELEFLKRLADAEQIS